MAAVLPFIAALSGAVGIAQGIKSLVGGNKQPLQQLQTNAPAKLPATPTIEDAAAKAQEAAKKRRRVSVLSGGVTNVTKGQALVPEANVGKKTLG